MRILVVCQHYWPEPFNVSEVCEELVRRGHEVTVLTGLPNVGMPGGNVPPEYKARSARRGERNGVRIERVWLWPRGKNALGRVANYLSFWRMAIGRAASLPESFDVVLGYQFSPIMQVDAGAAYSKRTGAPFLLYCFDLWPESLVAGGFRRDSFAFKWVEGVSRRIYAEADVLAATSEGFFGYFENVLGLNAKRKLLLSQFAEDAFTGCVEAEGSYDSTKINLTFAGNVGAVQSVETIVHAAALLKRDERFAFHVVGSGSALEGCEELANSLGASNVVFHGRRSLEDMPAFYAASDAMLLTFSDDPLLAYTLPRKVQSYLAAGRPVLAAAGGESGRVLEEAGCGLCCGSEDAEGLANACLAFANMTKCEREAMGQRAQAYYHENFSRDRFFEVLESELERMKGTKHGEQHVFL